MKTVIEMAREAGAGEPESLYGRTDYVVMTKFELERFAELVRADERARMAEQPAQQQTMYLESGGPGYGPAPNQKLIVGYVNKPEQPAQQIADSPDDWSDWKIIPPQSQPAQQGVDWEKLYRLEVKKKEALAAKYERDTGKKLTRIVPMAEQPAQPQQEPVCWVCTGTGVELDDANTKTPCPNCAEQPAQPAPVQGWKLVPVEPTYEMMCAPPYIGGEDLLVTWAAMIAAAPQPAQRTWVGLTDEEIDKTHETKVWDARRSYARAIEAKLKEKNT